MSDITVTAEPLDRIAASSGWVASTFDALNVPAYRLLWLNTFFMMTAVHLAFTAQGVISFDITGNNRAVGQVIFAQGIGMFVTTPFAGVIADRVPKRLLLGLAELGLAVMALSVAVLLYTDSLTIGFLTAGGFVFGASVSFFWPAQTAIMGDVISAERRGNGAALFQVCLHFTRSFAPFLAGGLIAWSFVGPGGTYLLTTLLFLPVLFTCWLLPRTPTGSSQTRVWQEIAIGVRYVRENRRLFEATLSFVIITLLGFSIIPILPGFTDALGAGDAGFGIIFGCHAIGAFVASMLMASKADAKSVPVLVAVSSFLFGVVIAVMGIMPTFFTALLLVLLVGGTAGAFQTLIIAAMLRASTPEYFGRVMSLTTVAWSLTNLLGLAVGVLADVFDERTVLVGVGVSVSLSAVLLALWSRPTAISMDPAVEQVV